MRLESTVKYKVQYTSSKNYSTFDDYQNALWYYQEKKEAGKRAVKLIEVRTVVTETVMEI